jgi:hypothetical protein
VDGEPFVNAEKFSPSPNPDRFSQRLNELRAALQNSNPDRLAEVTGSEWVPNPAGGEVQLLYWGQPVRVTAKDWLVYKGDSVEPASDYEQTMLLYYFTIADGAPEQNRWISFSDLPDGRFYTQAFQGYTGRELWVAFKDDVAAFENACQSLGGARQDLGDAAYRFQVLPHFPILVVYWSGDEDFSGSAQVLFDASASHYLTTDACAVLGSTITRKLIAAKPKTQEV